MKWIELSRLYQIPRKLLQKLMDSEEFSEQIAFDNLKSKPTSPSITPEMVKSQVDMRRARKLRLNRRV